MHNAIKFILALLASACVFYLLILVAKVYVWVAIPFIILAIVLLWKRDKFIGMGVLTAFVLAAIAVSMLIHAIAGMKINL